ncbi:MAG TPA: phosphate acyltransferase [Gemmatimonadales bacterium]|nr:phosphate acyltransferase [Gemmatimonadales bacterium]
MSFREELLRRAAANPARIVLAEGDDPRVQRAAERLLAEGITEPIVIGGGGIDPSADPRLGRIANHLRSRRPERVRDGVHALELAAEPLNFAASLVALGEADGCVGGAVFATAEVVRAALWAIGTMPGVSVVSSSFYMAMRSGQVLTFTDCAVVPEPTSDELAEIALSAVRARSSLVGDAPRVAFLSYSTRGSAAGPKVDRVRAALARFRELAPGVPADGELQADAALVPEICDRKAPGSPVGGKANVLVFPDLDAGNIAYKLVQRLAGAVALGPVLQGTRRPAADLSRGASADDIVEVAAMVALQKEPTTA